MHKILCIAKLVPALIAFTYTINYDKLKLPYCFIWVDNSNIYNTLLEVHILAVSGCSVNFMLNLSGHRLRKLDQSSLAFLKRWKMVYDTY